MRQRPARKPKKIEREFVFRAVADERRQIANLVDVLSDAELVTPSLCSGWDVKTVAAHVLSTLDDGLSAFLRLAARRASLAQAIDELARRRAQLPAAEIAASLHRYADRPVSPPIFGSLDPLADVLVHSVPRPLREKIRSVPRVLLSGLLLRHWSADRDRPCDGAATDRTQGQGGAGENQDASSGQRRTRDQAAVRQVHPTRLDGQRVPGSPPRAARREQVDSARDHRRPHRSKRVAGVSEIVGPAIYLACEASSFVTGDDIAVGGVMRK
jgi:hypothetical protein